MTEKEALAEYEEAAGKIKGAKIEKGKDDKLSQMIYSFSLLMGLILNLLYQWISIPLSAAIRRTFALAAGIFSIGRCSINPYPSGYNPSNLLSACARSSSPSPGISSLIWRDQTVFHLDVFDMRHRSDGSHHIKDMVQSICAVINLPKRLKMVDKVHNDA